MGAERSGEAAKRVALELPVAAADPKSPSEAAKRVALELPVAAADPKSPSEAAKRVALELPVAAADPKSPSEAKAKHLPSPHATTTATLGFAFGSTQPTTALGGNSLRSTATCLGRLALSKAKPNGADFSAAGERHRRDAAARFHRCNADARHHPQRQL